MSKRSRTVVALLKSTQLINCTVGRREPLACNLFARGVFALGKEGILEEMTGGKCSGSCRGSSTALCFSLLVGFFFPPLIIKNQKIQALVGILTGGLPSPRDLFRLRLYSFSD